MLFSEEKYRFMFAALQEAERAYEDGEVPVGAVIVHNNSILSRGYNQIERLKDPTAHAEMIAITSACNRLNDWRLEGCSIFVTLEPCIMCTGALLSARIGEIYYATNDSKFGACGSLHNLAEESKTNHKIKVYSGIYSVESQELLKLFFKQARKTSSKTTKPN